MSTIQPPPKKGDVASRVAAARSELRHRYVSGYGSQGFHDSVVLDLLEKFIDAKVDAMALEVIEAVESSLKSRAELGLLCGPGGKSQ